MPSIPQDFIDQVLDRTDIIEVVGTKVDLKKRGTNYLGLCPFHKEKTPSFSVNQSKQFYHCFGCGVGGNALKFLLEHDRMDFREAVRLLADKAGLVMPVTDGGGGINRQPLYEASERAAHWFVSQLETKAGRYALDYLEKRVLSKNIIQTYQLGFAPPGWDNLLKHLSRDTDIQHLVGAGLITENSSDRRFDRFRDRIIFPIRQVSGRTIAFAARALRDESQPKYLNSPDTPIFKKGHHLYGLYEAVAHRDLKRLLFVEGQMDVLGLANAGITGAVACMGTAVTPVQLNLAFRYVKELIFCFDGDEAGQKAADRALRVLLPVLADDCQVRFMFLPQGTDPDSLVREKGAETFLNLLTEALDAPDFLLAHLQRQYDASSISGRTQLAHQARPLLASVKGVYLKESLTQAIRDLTQLDPFSVKSLSPLPEKTDWLSSASRDLQVTMNPIGSTLYCLLMAPQAGVELAQEDRSWLSMLKGGQDAVMLDKVLQSLGEQPTESTAVLVSQFSGEDQDYLVALQNSEPPRLRGGWSEALKINWSGLRKEADKRQKMQRLRQQLQQVQNEPDLHPQSPES